MPPKGKKKRASLHLDSDSGQIKEGEVPEGEMVKKGPPVRQVVEVVTEEEIPEAIETIKKDAEEIENAAESIEADVKENAPETKSADMEEIPMSGDNEEVSEESHGSVESLFTKATSDIPPEITVVKKSDRSLGVWVGALLGVALAIGVSLFLLMKGPSRLPFMAAKPTPTPAPTMAPSPTQATANKKDIKVAVLNGGGVVGAGSKMKSLLEDKGYTVVSVGNAANYTYTDTEIHVKSGHDDYASLLKDDLKSDYSLASSTGVVDDSAAYDAQVIVGKQ